MASGRKKLQYLPFPFSTNAMRLLITLALNGRLIAGVTGSPAIAQNAPSWARGVASGNGTDITPTEFAH